MGHLARNTRLLAAVVVLALLFAAVGAARLAAGGDANGYSLLAEHWDGSAWTDTDGALGPTGAGGPIAPGAFAAVTASSSTDVWAVGSVATGSRKFQAVAEHFDGTSWSRVVAPATASEARTPPFGNKPPPPRG